MAWPTTTEDGLILASRPDLDDAWFGVTSATATQENADNFTVFARCWNPLANVPDTSARQANALSRPRPKRQLARMAHTR